MLKIVAFLLCLCELCALSKDAINPTRQEITRCLPSNKREKADKQLANLESFENQINLLAKFFNGSFKSNCKKITELLDSLDQQLLFNKNNLSKSIPYKKQIMYLKEIECAFKNGFDVILKKLENTESSIKHLCKSLKDDREITLLDIIINVDDIQFNILDICRLFKILHFLDFARGEIKGYEEILAGLNTQLFHLINLSTKLSRITKYIRSKYLELLPEGECSSDQIISALGITHKKYLLIKGD